MDVEQLKSSTDSLLHARIGSTLENRYEILDVLAEGGMGVVYRGQRLGLKRPVAVKFLHANFAADTKVRERFERELQAMSRLTHPNCISVVDYGIADSPFIVMEYVTGPTLRHVLAEQGRLSPVRALFIASQILAALAHAHYLDMIHRDIKPGNIILSDIEGTLDHVYVLDFGLAKFLSGAANDDLTASGMLLGTPSYMAPEQARAQGISAATDIYATGVVLFELLTGTKPYTGQHALDILHNHQFAPVPSIRERLPEGRFSPELDQAIQTAMAKDPAQRFASATAFSRALDQVPEAASIRTSTKLRALTPPPGLDFGDSSPASNAAAAAPAPKAPVIASAPDTIDVPVKTAPTRAVAPSALAALAAQSARDGQPQSLSVEASFNTSASTLSTLVPGGLYPRTTGPVEAAAAIREDTPMSMAVAPLARFGSGTTRIALVGALVAIVGLTAWLATRDGASAEHTAAAAPDQRMHTALAVAGPAVPASEVPAPASDAPATAAAQPEILQAATAQPATEPDPAAAAAQLVIEPDPSAEATGASADVAAIQAVAENPPAGEEETARALPRPQDSARSPVDSIDDIERLLQQGRRDEAMQGILRLRRTNFTRSGYLAFQLGNLYFDKMQWSKGLEAYEDALRLKPEYRGNPTLNNNAIRALSHNQTWRKVSALYTDRIRQAGVKYLREAAQSDRSSVVRQRARQLLGRLGGRK
jgi:serine/threonine protein kinase